MYCALVARMAASPAARGPGNDTAVSDANLALDATHAGPVVYASWEDEREEAGRRIAKFGADELATPADLAGRLRYLDLRGEGPLWGPGGEARHLAALGELTPVGRRVRATCEILDARLLVVDSLAGAYGSDENVRALVRAFCADWDRWATDARCAVMLVSHPSKTPGGAGAGQVDRDYAGSGPCARTPLEMSYEALATSPEREVARAVEWLGLDFEPGQMDWAEKEHHHIQGNHLRLNRDGRISLDRRWETGLTTWQKVCIRAVTLPTRVPGSYRPW